MTQRTFIECDRCGKPSNNDRRGWSYVDWRSTEAQDLFDLCPDCTAMVVRELEMYGRRPVRHD